MRFLGLKLMLIQSSLFLRHHSHQTATTQLVFKPPNKFLLPWRLTLDQAPHGTIWTRNGSATLKPAHDLLQPLRRDNQLHIAALTTVPAGLGAPAWPVACLWRPPPPPPPPLAPLSTSNLQDGNGAQCSRPILETILSSTLLRLGAYDGRSCAQFLL